MDSPHQSTPVLPVTARDHNGHNPGYQTPTERYFPQETVLSRPTTPTPPTTPTTARLRPQILRLTSYLRRQDAVNATGNRLRPDPDIQPSLDELLHVSSRPPKSGVVTIKDRIACYQWTFFTMVSVLRSVSPTHLFLVVAN